MKRFWTAVVVTGEGPFGIALDGRPVRTPARAVLDLPRRGLAEAIAGEWAAQEVRVDPATMPLTGLANAAIDRVSPDPARFAEALARYGESDLLCYRAEEPDLLVERQAAAWDPLLQWARRRLDVDFAIAAGVMHVAQPEATVRRLAQEVAALDPWRLAALSPLVTIGGSLVAGLAVIEDAVSAEQGWTAVSLDEAWQIEKWGHDVAAVAALEARRRDFLAAARFVDLLS